MSGIVTQNVLGNSGLVKAVAAAGGAWTEIKSITASCDATLSFVNGTSDVVLDSTYPVYCFRFINIHPETDDKRFQFNLSEDTGSSYAVTKTTTVFETYHNEGDTETVLQYSASADLAQSTAPQIFQFQLGNDNDQSLSGYFYLFNPSSTTFVKHFYATCNFSYVSDYSYQTFIAGYGNTTSAVDAIQFSMTSGDIDTGKIKLFGIKDS